jgi:hypothetical protein
MPRGETTRSKIEKVNATIAGLLTEMRDNAETEQFIDWGDLINKLKQYRSDLEDELTEEEENALPFESTTPEPHKHDGWSARDEQKFLDDPDMYERNWCGDSNNDDDIRIETDEDDYIIEPDDDDLEIEEEDYNA